MDPEEYFSGFNVGIHGIDVEAVRNAPRFPDLSGELKSLLSGKLVVTHTGFDKLALFRVEEKYGIQPTECEWLDTAQVCRHAWKQFRKAGYGLQNVADWCGIEFLHHNAEEDARAAGLVLLCAIADTGLNLDDWIKRLTLPIDPSFATDSDRNATLSFSVNLETGPLDP